MFHLYPESSVAGFLSSPSIRKLLFAFLLVGMVPLMASATHFRYGNITWTNTTGNTVVFKIQQSWRYTYPWGFTPTVGTYINITASGSAQFSFGDGTTAAIILQITSVNIPENWFYGEATIVKTYATPGLRTAFWQSQSRISSLQNNANGSYRVETKVNVGAGNISPVLNITPMVNLATGNPAATFTIPAVDPDGGPLTFSLATSLQAAGAGFTYVHPEGLSLDNQRGIVTFSTIGKLPGQLYTTQIIVTDQSGASVAIDFVIRIVAEGNPPVFDYVITPQDRSILTVIAGTPITFDIKAVDSDPQQVILSAAGVPVGASFSPPLAAVGNPVASTFNWTPSINQVGNFIISFQAVDPLGLSGLTSVTIQVISCNITLSLKPRNVKCFSGNDGAIDLEVTGGTAPLSYIWSNGENSEDLEGLKAGAYTVSVRDKNGCQNEISSEILEPGAPLTMTSSIISISCNGGSGALTITGQGGTTPYTFEMGNEINNSGSFTGLNAGNHAYSITDANGCTYNGLQYMDEPGPIVPEIKVIPTVSAPGMAVNTIYLGYGPQLLRLLSASTGGSGNYTYSWGNGDTGSTISVSPTITTTYILTVKDNNGCEATKSLTINVVDPSCGNKNDKVSVCHKAIDHYINICVSPSAVAAHLAHGDQLGRCDENTAASEKNYSDVLSGKPFAMVYPNPATTLVNVRWRGNDEFAIMKVIDVQGKVRLIRKFTGLKEDTNVKSMNLDGFNKGVYILQIISGKNVQMLKFTIK